jgi:hypothetical protein
VHSDTEAPGGHCQIESRLLQLKLCLNGHEWAKRQLQRRRLPFTALDNGFLDCADPAVLQRLCDQLSDMDIEAFSRRWLRQLPPPPRSAGYWAAANDLHLLDRGVNAIHEFSA